MLYVPQWDYQSGYGGTWEGMVRTKINVQETRFPLSCVHGITCFSDAFRICLYDFKII